MTFREIWALTPERISRYLEKEYGKTLTDGVCTIGPVSVHVTPLSANEVLIIPVPRSEVVFEGPADETQTAHHRFVMNFLSAGG